MTPEEALGLAKTVEHGDAYDIGALLLEVFGKGQSTGYEAAIRLIKDSQQ